MFGNFIWPQYGEWTPVIGGSGGTSGQTYTLQVGRYIKIGKMVVAKCTAVLSNKGTITGNVQVQGLPFSCENVGGATWNAQVVWDSTVTSFVNLSGYMNPGASPVNIVGITAAGTTIVVPLVDADISNTTALGFSIVYRTDN